MLSHLSHVRLFETPWTMARQAPLPMVAMPSSRGSSQPRQGSNPFRLHWQVGGFFTTSATWELLEAKGKRVRERPQGEKREPGLSVLPGSAVSGTGCGTS